MRVIRLVPDTARSRTTERKSKEESGTRFFIAHPNASPMGLGYFFRNRQPQSRPRRPMFGSRAPVESFKYTVAVFRPDDGPLIMDGYHHFALPRAMCFRRDRDHTARIGILDSVVDQLA